MEYSAPLARLWHVQVTVSGARAERRIVEAAMNRLSVSRPFFSSLSFDDVSAELSYWEEADTLIDAASLALRLWNEHRAEAALPHWEVVGLEVVEQEVHLERSDPLGRRNPMLRSV